MRTALATAVIFLATQQAYGTVVNADGHPAAGGLPAILDEATNRLWLDLPYTEGMSYLSVWQLTDPGEALEDWTLATTADVFGMLANAGITNFSGPGLEINETVGNLVDIWGHTEETSIDGGTMFSTFFSYTPQPEIASTVRYGFLRWQDTIFSDDFAVSNNDAGPLNTVTAYADIGIALYKEVPEPTAYTLALTAILCLTMSRRFGSVKGIEL